MMFCPKCGTKSLDGAEFCQKCGAKLIVNTSTEHSAATPLGSSTQQPNSVPMNTSGKKKSKLPIVLLGIVAALAFVLVVLAVIGSTSNSEPPKNDDADISSHPVSSAPNEEETPASAAPNDSVIRFKGIPFDDIFGAPYTDVFEMFGQPDIWEDTWEYTNDVIFYTNAIDHLAANGLSSMRPADFEYHGHTFDGTFDELVGLLGDDYESLGAAGYQWVIGDYCLDFYIPRDTDRVESVDVSHIDTDIPINNDEYLGDDSAYYPNVDSSLVGRWRAYDGGYVEFDEYGNAAVSFRPGASILPPDYITWEVSNGQIVLSSHFSDAAEWKLADYNWGQLLTLSRTTYTRSETDTSLVGTWIEVGDRYQTADALVLFADGTGTINKVVSSATWKREIVPISWWTDDTNFYSEWTLLSGYDYTISGNTLTIYFSNGSQIYTKVGN